jgi:cell division cycle 20-like protein 1, cofactor of APC complex
VLAVGLGSCIYLWAASTGHVNKLHDLGPCDHVTSVQWQSGGGGSGADLLAIGTNLGIFQIWDAAKAKKVRELTGHTGRICTIAWGSKLLATGGRDCSIV